MDRSIRLSDGGVIEIRPIRPADRTVLQEGLARMGPESRYRRFFAPISRLSDAQLAYLTEVDHHDHEALVAFEHASRAGVGVARYVRLERDGDVAEPAVVVIDDWQGRGIGARLLGALAERARQEGIHSFLAPVLADNAAAIATLSALGHTTATARGNEVELLISLEGNQAAALTLGTLLRQSAEQTIRPSLSFWHRLLDRDRDVAE